MFSKDVGLSGPPLVASTRAVTAIDRGNAALMAERPNLERKYVFHAGQAHMLGVWLSATLAPDPAFAVGQVSSLYFDTPQLHLYHEKRNSDFLKTKVRLRWYDRPASAVDPVTCYLEIKKKIGAIRSKERVEVPVPPHVLRDRLFTDPAILDAPGMADPSLRARALVPLLVVQYQRSRFVDPITGARVALDTEICVRQANPQFLPHVHPVMLPLGVLETKGVDRQLPATLEALALHFRRETFSKYAVCCEHVMSPHGRRL